ncbi:MinD-like ATPase involved in chromosome partitioning or flagellar assembly [Marinomonas polaris DSM 16579]|uniref:MinD-like ATPase involved in chromosome partitioning or flagellar assembly n=1 Tax=Marinomonas polaris DSM 16579 TaxID=1122206 RepID=A0A1M5EYU5_9GAMM|nr:AAA family ATPase [Marinomonas polaris]SHF84480.1 MinD-like ATPase involved in chromosome partitioning or flagellar assembly [Marinomonas polaris DSM 16579]
MLESFKFIDFLNNSLSGLIESKDIYDFNVKLNLNQSLIVSIFSDSISDISSLAKVAGYNEDLSLYEVEFVFLDSQSYEDESYLFEGEDKINLGVRRSLDGLIEESNYEKESKTPVVTFYSYKGGVGRTTSLVLFSRYLANKGKRVFVVDCDFEAPGLINFFDISQFDNPKNGVIEYFNDKKFIPSLELNSNYVYETSSTLSGEGKINMMPAGNIFDKEKNFYLEGLSRIDIQGKNVLLRDFDGLVKDIEKNYSPDVILFDSRTGFNNVFGVLSQLSNKIVALAGDDIQNRPGLEFLYDKFVVEHEKSKLCIILSILSISAARRHNDFKDTINNQQGLDNSIPVFHFVRENDLEFIGTKFEKSEDVKDLMNYSTQYKDFFSYLSDEIEECYKLSSDLDQRKEVFDESISEAFYAEETSPTDSVFEGKNLSDILLDNLLSNFPEKYAENVTFNDNFFENDFYVRQCMHDLFLPEYKILLGGKGTGKTAFYKALQDDTFFELLVIRAEKKHLNFDILNVIPDDRAKNSAGFISLSSFFDEKINNENFVNKFWNLYLWLAICRKNAVYRNDLYFEVRNDLSSAKKITDVIEDDTKYLKIEESLYSIDEAFKKNDSRLIVTFDQLDFVVKPNEWDVGISPLIRLCQNNNWERIFPKLFLRRDLYKKLGNITNKSSIDHQIINLEWSPDEMYVFLFKIIYAYSKQDFIEFLSQRMSKSYVKNVIESKLKKKNQLNQLPTDENVLKPLVTAFFGKPRENWLDSYEALYNNLKNADKTVSLRPFLDLIKLAINEQKRDGNALRGDAVLNVAYCESKSVRSEAVDNYFKDLASEEGNELIKYVVEDIRNGLVTDDLKYSSLLQNDFEKLIFQVKNNHPDLKEIPFRVFEEMLELNGIVFMTFIPGGKKKYSFAYLYKYYMGLKSPKSKSKFDIRKKFRT